MAIQSVSRWQWVIVGALAGVLIAVGRIISIGNEPLGGEGFVSLAEFQLDLRLPAVMGKPRLIGLTVRSERQVDVLTMDRIIPETLHYQECQLAVPRPFHPLARPGIPAQVYPSITQYLAASYPAIPVRYAWWDEPGGATAIWVILGTLVVGGIWPTVLRLLLGANSRESVGLAYGLRRFTGDQKEPRVRSEASATDIEKLRELEEEMVDRLLESAAPTAPSQAPAPPAAAQPLNSAPGDGPSAPQAGGKKDYRGEFYPVVRTAVAHEPEAKRSRASGFTLIELLVVVGIVAILISILLPTLRSSRRSAQTVLCAAQLRQLGMALQIYADSNKGWLPAWSGWQIYPDGQSSDDPPGLGWMEELAPYYVKPDSVLYNCPGFPSEQRLHNYFLAAQWSGRSGRHSMKLTDVKMNGQFVLSGDKTQRGLYPPPFGTNEHLEDDCDPDDFGGGRPVLAWPWDPGGFYMHPRGNNILFDDMHVALFNAYDKSAMTFNPLQMEDWADVTPE